MFRCRTMILARSSEIHRPRKLGYLHVGLWCRGETPLPLGLDRTYIGFFRGPLTDGKIS